MMDLLAHIGVHLLVLWTAAAVGEMPEPPPTPRLVRTSRNLS